MANSSSVGPTQNNGRIEWFYSVGSVGQSTASVTVTVTANFRQVAPSHQNYTGSRSWSGAWGSGSAPESYNLGPGAVKLLQGPRAVSVALTDSAQNLSFSVTASHWFGSTSSTLNVQVPARYAAAPSGLSVARESDVSHRLSWARNSTYSSVVVQRREDDAGWVQVGRPSGNPFTWTDSSTRAGHKYEYRVAGVGGSGQSAWSGSTTVFTSPLAPSGVSAERVGLDIRVDVAGRPAYVSGFNVRDGDAVVASGVSMPWTHVGPAPSSAHTYTVQGVVSGLAGAWSAPSNTVQLLAAPAAPSGLAPNGGVTASDVGTVFRWKHNPVDSSAQTAGEVRYRVKGASVWTTRTVAAVQSLTVVLPSSEHEWQVRTKGSHADWSPWSAVAVFTVIDRPGVAVTAPDAVWTQRTVRVAWSWLQGQGRPQSAWEVELSSADGVLERKTGSGAAGSVLFASKLDDGVEYEVTVRGAAGEVWSAPAAQSFTVLVPPAAPAWVEGVWGEESGAVTVQVSDGRGPVVAPITNHFTNPRLVGDGTWVEVRRNLAQSARLTVVNGGGTLTAMPLGGRAGTRVGGPVSNASGFCGPGATVGDFVSVSADVAALSVADVGKVVEARMYGGAGFLSGTVRVTLGVVGEKIRVTVPPTAALSAATGTSLRLFVYPAGGPTVPSDFWVGDILTERVKGLGLNTGEFFDGEMSPDSDFRARWVGTVGSSDAVLEAQRVRGFSTPTGVTAAVSTRSGKPALRLLNLGGVAWSSVHAWFTVPAAVYPGGLLVGTRHQDQELTPLPAAGGYNLRVDAPTQQSPQTNVAGPVAARLEFSALTGTYRAYLSARVSDGDVWWTDIGLFTVPTYAGPVFHGSSGLVEVEGSWMAATWAGPIDNSPSTLRMAPPAARADVERSVDGGATWETITTNTGLPVVLTDPEALSHGITTYRVTTYSADDAVSVALHHVTAESDAIWLSGGIGFMTAMALPFDPKVSVTAARQRVTRRYAGRPLPVTHVGETLSRVVDTGGTILTGEQSPDDLANLAQNPAPVHLYRDPDGRRIYGALGDVQLQRESHAHWGFGFQLTETEKQ